MLISGLESPAPLEPGRRQTVVVIRCSRRHVVAEEGHVFVAPVIKAPCRELMVSGRSRERREVRQVRPEISRRVHGVVRRECYVRALIVDLGGGHGAAGGRAVTGNVSDLLGGVIDIRRASRDVDCGRHRIVC